MKLASRLLMLSTLVGSWPATYAATPIDTLLQQYRQQGTNHFNAAAGRRLWILQAPSGTPPQTRSCTSCHSVDPRQPSKHVRTGKPIGPLAPSVNSDRLTDIGEIRKWFKRNCTWTFGRECTPQEKGDVLTFLRDL